LRRKPLLEGLPHTATSYWAGCRCDDCRAANAKQQRAFRNRRWAAREKRHAELLRHLELEPSIETQFGDLARG
jgi:hypothetical protein